MSGMILVESFFWIPIVFLLMSTPFRSMDPSLEEAATTAGSNGWQVFRRVTFPLAMPSVLAVLILTIIRSLEAFEIPALIGIPAGCRSPDDEDLSADQRRPDSQIRRSQRLLDHSDCVGRARADPLLPHHQQDL